MKNQGQNNQLSLEEQELVTWKVEDEGLEYTMRFWNNFKNIKDEKFHELRKNFIKAAEELESYIGL